MGITMGEERRRNYKYFSLRISSSLSNKVCVVETFLRVFLSIGFLFSSIHFVGIRVFIVGYVRNVKS